MTHRSSSSNIQCLDTSVQEPMVDSTLSDNKEGGNKENPSISDGGWGWMVCAGSFMVNFMIDGTMYSFGILLLELLEDFQESKAATSWAGSIQLGMSMLMGPVVSLLLKRFSIRQVTAAGTLLSAGGFITSVFAPNLTLLICMYGIVAGIGFSMIFLPAIIVVGLYFNRKRAIVTGIATSGAGLGTFAYAFLCNQLLQYYTWRQTVLILTGILLNCLACAMVFRPLLLPKSKKDRTRKCKLQISTSKSSKSLDEEKILIKENREVYGHMVKDQRELSSGGDLDHSIQEWNARCSLDKSTAAPILFPVAKIYPINKYSSSCPFLQQQQKKVLYSALQPQCHRLFRSVDEIHENKSQIKQSSLKGAGENFISEFHFAPGGDYKTKNKNEEGINVTVIESVLCTDADDHVDNHLNQCPLCDGIHKSVLDDSMMQICSSDVRMDSGVDAKTLPLERKCRGKLSSLLAWDLFSNITFNLLLIIFTMWTVQSVPLTYLPALAVSKGMNFSEAAFLISIVGMTNTAGRIMAGIMADIGRLRGIWLYVIALFVASVVNFIIPWCQTFVLLATASAIFGLCMAVTVSLRTIVLVEQLGIEALTKSFGVVALFQGIGFTLCPPLAGKLFDLTGAFYFPFGMAGCMYLVSALASLAIGLRFKPNRAVYSQAVGNNESGC